MVQIAGGCVAGVSALSMVANTGVSIGNMIQSRRRDDQTIALANRIVDLGDKKLEQVIEEVSAQVSELRQAIQDTANRAIDTKREEVHGMLDIAKETSKTLLERGTTIANRAIDTKRKEVHGMLDVAKETSKAALTLLGQGTTIASCVYLGCAHPDSLIQYSAIAMAFGLMGISFKNWQDYFFNPQANEDAHPFDKPLVEIQLGQYQALLTAEEKLYLQEQCLSVLLFIKQKDDRQSYEWTQEESEWLKQTNSDIFSMINAKIPGYFNETKTNFSATNTHEDGKMSAPSMMTISTEQWNLVMNHMRNMAEIQSQQNNQNIELDKKIAELSKQNIERDKEIAELSKQNIERDKEIAELSKQIAEAEDRSEKTLAALTANLENSKRWCQIGFGVTGALLGPAAAASIVAAPILAPLAPTAAFIGISAEAAPLIGLFTGGFVGGKVVGPGVHYLAHREQYRQIEELNQKK